MRRWLALVVTTAALAALLPASPAAGSSPTPKPTARATPTPRSTPRPTPRPTTRPTTRPSPGPTRRPPPRPSSRPSSRQLRAARAAALRRLIERVRREFDGEVADSLVTVAQLADALGENADQQSQVESQIVASQAQLDALDQEIGQDDDDIAATQQQIANEQADIASLARQLYEQPDSLVLRLLQARSVGGLVTQASDLTAAALRADSLRKEVSASLGQLQQEQSGRQDARNQQAQAQADLAAAEDQLRALALQEQETAEQLHAAISHARSALDRASRKKKVSLAEEVAAALQRQEQDLAATTEQQVWQQEQLRQGLDPASVPTAGADPGTGDDQGENAGPGPNQQGTSGTAFTWPLRGAVVTQGFGPTTLWLEPAMFGFAHFHTGIDLASPDTSVTAAGGGVVAAVGSSGVGYGTYVIVDDGGGLLTLYGHLAAVTVRAGDRVAQGQPIGVEGSTGNSTGVHLHFEVRRNGRPVDPTPYLPPLSDD